MNLDDDWGLWSLLHFAITRGNCYGSVVTPDNEARETWERIVIYCMSRIGDISGDANATVF